MGAGALRYDWRGEIDSDVGGVVEDGDGFGVDLLVDPEDGRVNAERGVFAICVMVECVDASKVGAEEALINLRA